MKILALNLPQFHEVKENNEWWGEYIGNEFDPKPYEVYYKWN